MIVDTGAFDAGYERGQAWGRAWQGTPATLRMVRTQVCAGEVGRAEHPGDTRADAAWRIGFKRGAIAVLPR